MRKLITALLLFSTSIIGTAQTEENDEEWTWMIESIIQVESSGNPLARSKGGGSVGILQITPIAVKDCNLILGRKEYTLQDRLNPERSREMFDLIQGRYNPEKNIEKAIRLWNGGPGYTIRGTQTYFEKVMKHFKNKKKM